MDATQLLKDFAKSQGIKSEEVDKFLKQFNDPKTLAEVVALPYDMQHHETYVTWLDEPLQSFIMDDWYDGGRYETLTVDGIVDYLCDRMYDLVYDDTDDLINIDIQTVTAKDEDSKEQLEYLKSIAQSIIDTKFGSVKIDW